MVIADPEEDGAFLGGEHGQDPLGSPEGQGHAMSSRSRRPGGVNPIGAVVTVTQCYHALSPRFWPSTARPRRPLPISVRRCSMTAFIAGQADVSSAAGPLAPDTSRQP